MRVRQDRLRDDRRVKSTCVLIRKPASAKQPRDGQPTDNYRHNIQSVRIFDGVNVEPRIVKYDLYTDGPGGPGIED